MERLARARRFWTIFGDVGIVATVTMGVLMLVLLVLQLFAFASDPVGVAENAPPAITLVGLPGVNPIIPLWFGIAGLVIALVVHEGSHGVLARLGAMKVKSTGLLLCVVPIGAFVEPDEKDLERAPIRHRNRVFAAGPWANLLVAIVAGVLFSSLFVTAMAPPAAEGVTVTSLVPGAPAQAAGLAAGDVLLGMRVLTAGPVGTDGDATGAPVGHAYAFANQTAFSAALNETAAGQAVALGLLRDGKSSELTVTLSERAAATRADGREPKPWEEGKGFLGVSTLDARVLKGLRDALADPFAQDGIGLFFFYPLFVFANRVDILNAPFSALYDIEGPLGALPPGLFFGLANLLYWVFWLNLMLGSFNALPAGPLDGGQMFRASLRDFVWKRLGVDRDRVALEPGPGDRGLFARGLDDETQGKLDRAQHVVRRVTLTLGLFILAMILLPILAPKLVLLFA
ncbi:MAG TPA: site-2 protease family protein, partial [Candidatus Thermoplasmatota archaeon]|nr:site-2 protease family protein [Candidatus Thermoplasmatota archaeon]